MPCATLFFRFHSISLIIVTAATLALFQASAAAAPHTFQTLMEVKDAQGDDHGAGGIVYPLDEVFHPFQDLFDLLSFRIGQDDHSILFEFYMGALTNPFDAPEGFYHQRIDVYIHTGDGGGLASPLRTGAGVDFSPKYPWHMWLRVAPFGGTALYTWEDPPDAPGRQGGITTEALKDVGVIRVQIPRDLLPSPRRSWRYYVIVGSFDGFGEDGYRAAAGESSRWLLGGAAPQSPPVVDLLAPTWGPRRQEAQLSYEGGRPILYPVGGFDLYRIGPGVYLILLIALVGAFWVAVKRHQFFSSS